MLKKRNYILPLLALAALCWLYWPAQPSYIPRDVRGLWKTDHPRYADRYLDISEAIFTVGQGDRTLQVFFVQRVEQKALGAGQAYTLHYTSADHGDQAPSTLTFHVASTANGRRLQLPNQKGINWYRETPPGHAARKTGRP
jgi:hypothetical protein